MYGSSERSWGSKGDWSGGGCKERIGLEGGFWVFGWGRESRPRREDRVQYQLLLLLRYDLGARVSAIWEGRRGKGFRRRRDGISAGQHDLYTPRVERVVMGLALLDPVGPMFAGGWWALMAHICTAHVRAFRPVRSISVAHLPCLSSF